ncbi:MAG: hypothetical protein NTV87_13355, partial [Ignavibacteriae bacterium]|nr:hypothetical protein [Ignavibacteriota bacterium]
EDKAIECWKDALKADVHHLESTFNYGYFRWQKAEITGDDLVIQMDAIKLAHQNNPDYWLSFGWIHYERGDADAINEIQNTENRITDEKFLKGLKYKERPIGKRKFEGHTEWVNSVCFSPDGRCILSGSGEFGGKDNTLRLWEVQTVKEIRKFKGHSNWIKSSCFSPDGRFVLSGSGDNTLRLWAINAGKEIKKFKGHTADVTSVCFSLDGMYVLSGSEDKTIRLWDVSTCEEIRKYEGHTDVVNSVCISPDGRNALSGSKDTTIRLWYIQSGKENRKFEGHTEAINSVCFSPDGRYILSGSKDTTIRLWDIITGKEIRIFEGHTDVVNSVCISPNGRYALSGSGGEYWGKDYSIRLWDIKSGKEIKRFEGHTKCVKSICFSPDGRFVLSGSWDKTIQLWGMYLPEKNFDNNFPILNKINTTSDIITHEEIITEEFNKIKIFLNEKRYTEAYEIIEELQRSSDYERSPDLLCIKHNCCTESGFKRKQIRNGWSKNILAGHTDSVTSVCISSDARYALSASRDKTIRLWDINTVKEIRKFEGHTDAINNVCISPDGRYALTGSNDKTIRMLDIQSGKEIRKFIGHTSYVNSVNFSPDGKYALSGSDDKTIRMWDIESGKEIRRFETGTKFNNSVCISPDGRYALSGSYNKTISLWDIESGKEIRNFNGHTNVVNSVCFSPDGRYVLSGSSDRTIRIWNIESEKEISKFKGHTDGVTSVCFFPDGKFALSGSCDKTIRLWDIESQREIGKFELHTEGVTSVYLSLDGRYAISGSFDKTLRLWEFDWDCEIQFQADWDEGARPYLDNFLILHQPYSEDGVSRIGKPVWNEEDFKRLLNNLKLRGYGGLKPEIIKTKLIKQTDNWDTRKHRLQASEQIKIYEYVKYNVTETIIIGKQEWMSENLSGEHYRNGDTIPQVHDIKEWKMLTIGAWCYYDNNVKNGKTYGKLYNWYAVNDPRGLAPDGWHIPSDAEWSELTDYLGGAQVAGGKLKATKLWNSPNINTANGSGFNAFPGGVRKYGNNFYIGWAGYFWSSSEESNIFAWDRVLASDFSDVLRGFYGKKNGLSVRCIRD